jgi:nitrite reductase (cytochrome c-552)
LKNVYDRQDKVYEQKIALEEQLVKAHIETAFAIEKGASNQQLKPIHKYIRAAQWRWDFVAASHGASFHSPLESMRIISSGLEKVAEARFAIIRLLSDLGYNKEIDFPDINSKEKAQEYLNLKMDELNLAKSEWLKNVLPIHLKRAEERQSKMPMPERYR